MAENMEQRARELVAHVQGVYDDGGYAAGDSPPFPLDEMQWLLDEVARLGEFTDWALDFLGRECRYDHNGYCQNHALDPKPCPVEQITSGNQEKP